MPIKRSGRSVMVARRVIDIEDVLLAIKVFAKVQDERLEDFALYGLILSRGFDNDIAIAKAGVIE